MKNQLLIFGIISVVYGIDEKRKMQEVVSPGGICPTMIPPSPLPPDNSDCWQWYIPPAGGKLPPDSPAPPQGCSYTPCQDAVCDCDPYCCNSAWDLSCRGYYMKSGDSIENNYFIPGCSAKLLCCEPQSAFPDPPVGDAQPPLSNEPFTTELNVHVVNENVVKEYTTP